MADREFGYSLTLAAFVARRALALADKLATRADELSAIAGGRRETLLRAPRMSVFTASSTH